MACFEATGAKGDLVTGVTEVVAHLGDGNSAGTYWETCHESALTGIAFAVAVVLASQAFAANANDNRCTNYTLKNGHFVCGDMGDNS